MSSLSVLISCGQHENPRFQALACEAYQRETVFRISPQVYAAVAGDPALAEYTTGDSLHDGWMKVTESPSYSNPDVSNVMDQARRFIASSSDRPEDVVEKPTQKSLVWPLSCCLRKVQIKSLS